MSVNDWLNRVDELGGNEYELEHLPEEEEKSFLQMVAVWGGAAFVPATLLIGGSVAGSLSFPNFIATFGIGFFLVSLVSILVGITARHYGLSFHVTSRYFFGKRGSIIPSGLLVLTRIGFAAVEIALAATFASQAFGGGIPNSFIIATIVLGVFYVGTALIGIDALQWISTLAIPFVTIVFVYGAYTLGLGSVATPVEDPMSFTAAIGIAASFWIAGAIVSGDWLRYAKSKAAIVGSTWIALIFFTMFLAVLGFLTVFASSSGTHSLSQAMADAGLAIPAAMAMILLVWSTVDNWLYSAALGLSNIFEIRKVTAVLGVGAVAVAIASLEFHSLLLPYISAIGVFIPPLIAPWLLEFYVLDHRMSNVKMGDLNFAVNWLAIAAWAIGAAIAWFTPTKYIVPLVAIVASGVAYLILYYALRDTPLYPLSDLEGQSAPGSASAAADD